MKILIQHDDQRLGPYTDDEARAALASGAVRPEDLAWREGTAAWIPLAGLLAQPVGAVGTPPFPQAGPPPTSGMAIASLILGIFSFMCVLVGIPAVVFGHVARSKISHSQGRLSGSGLALAGLILGYLGTFLSGSMFFAVAIPSFLRARERSIEHMRMNDARQIYADCTMYQAAHQGKLPPSLNELVPTYLSPADAKKLIADPRHPELGENAWLYYGAGISPDRLDSPATQVLLASKRESLGQRVVVHYDGSTAIEYFNPPVR